MASIHEKEVFSLLIMCYNHEKYIEEAIQSALAQTYENIEVIICDDCSTDNSWGIIQLFLPKLQKRFNRVVAFRNSCNMGLVKSFNKMIEETRGTVIFCLSGDDMMAENYSADIMQACLECPQASVFVTDGYLVDEDAKYSELDISLLTSFYVQKPDFCKDTLFERLFWRNCIFAPGVSLRKEVYEKFGLYDAEIWIEDLEYWLRISRTKETEFIYLDKKDIYYRKNPDSLTSDAKNESYIERKLAFLEAMEKIIDKYGVYVERGEYIKRKWECLLTERRFYQVDMPEEEGRIIRKKLFPFVMNNWDVLGGRKLITCIHIYIRALLNKVFIITR